MERVQRAVKFYFDSFIVSNDIDVSDKKVRWVRVFILNFLSHFVPCSLCFGCGMILLNPVALACSIVIIASLIDEEGDVDVDVLVDEGPSELSMDLAS
jgi:hypothetical protein